MRNIILWCFAATLWSSTDFFGMSAAVGAEAASAVTNWPQWRFDANRSAATEAPGPSGPGLLWERRLGRPDAAYDHQYRMCADVTYAPIAAEGILFVPSNIDDCMTAFDLDTGSVRWRFATEGPVRFAPVYYQGHVIFGSDDGWLYCLTASNGAERWRLRGVPESLPNSRMLVGGRLASRWPVRGGPVVQNGVVYFGAGIWPEEGVYVTAVDAATGEVLWQTDAMSYVENGMSDHGRAYDLSLPPQGYLAMIDGRLAVPSGRSLAAWFDPANGRMEPYTCFYVKTSPPRGTWWLAGVNQYCVQGGNWFGTRPGAVPPLPEELASAKPALYWSREMPDNERYVIENRPFLAADTYRLHNENLYIEPVLTETTMYASEYADELKYLVPRGHTRVAFPGFDRIVARDLSAGRWTATSHTHIAYGGKRVAILRLEFPVLWQLDSPLRVLIKAGDCLYAGGEDIIAAIAIPDAGEQPRIAWQGQVHGTPVEALVTDEKLVVVTERGHVHCFGDGATQSMPTPDASDQEKKYASPPNGFACVVGAADTTKAATLARKQGYRVIQFVADQAIAAQARAELMEGGLSARQVQIIAGRPDPRQLTPYWANLVAVESLDAVDAVESLLAAALDLLRPCTGKLVMADRTHAELLQRLVDDRPGYAIRAEDRGVAVDRVAPPDGADDWTHEPGGPGNRFSNSEQQVKWPLGVLWYSGDIDRYFTPATHFQHQREPYPLVVDGRMFLITGNELHAIDIYTGNYLWRAEMPMTPWVHSRLFDSRQYGRPTERHCAAAKDWIYVVVGEEILAYDTQTGRQVRTLSLPPELKAEARAATPEPERAKFQGHEGILQAAPSWTEVRLCGDLLLAVLGRTLAAIDRHSGELCWARPSTRETTTYAIGDGTLFGLDCDLPRFGRGDPGESKALLFAMNPSTGEILWQREPDLQPVPKHEVRIPRPWLLPIIPEVAYNARHDLIVMTVNRNSLHVFDAADGSPAWSKRNVAGGDLQRIYPPVVTDDYLVVSNYQGCFGFLLDVRTGEELGQNTGIPQPRTCARILGNNELLAYRDAATELYDIEGNRMIQFNSLRSGCTTSFIPAGGVMTAPMLGHGCVCNYPMFASLGLYHLPEIERHRPAIVTRSWVNQAESVIESDPFLDPDTPVNIKAFRSITATLAPAGSAMRLTTEEGRPGYAIRKSDEPIRRGIFTVAVKRTPGSRRHGNAFLAFGPGDEPGDWIECHLYYGGRSSMMITGQGVETIERKIDLEQSGAFTLIASVDCEEGTVAFQVGKHKLTTTLDTPISAITHYGVGGANCDNLFTGITLNRP